MRRASCAFSTASAGASARTIRKISHESYRRAGIRITDYLDEDARRTGDPFAVLVEAFEAEDIVVFDVEATGVDPTRDEIIRLPACVSAGTGRQRLSSSAS